MNRPRHHGTTARARGAQGRPSGGSGAATAPRRHKTLSGPIGGHVNVSQQEDQRGNTPTPSEKVSRWHRDIFLVSPPSSNAAEAHPRHCICDACMAEYGTFRLYNQLLREKAAENAPEGAPGNAAGAMSSSDEVENTVSASSVEDGGKAGHGDGKKSRKFSLPVRNASLDSRIMFSPGRIIFSPGRIMFSPGRIILSWDLLTSQMQPSP